MASHSRQKIRITTRDFRCNWGFKPSDALLEESLDEMKQKYEAQRDKEVAAHDCVKHPSAVRPKTE